MPKFKISQFLAADVPEADVDQIGRAMLVEEARMQRMTITGDVERVYDELVVGVSVPGSDGRPVIKHVPLTDPLAAGRKEPDARHVEWEADAEPITADPAPRVHGGIGDDGASRAVLPREVVEGGGMVAFRHNLGTPDVLVTAYAADGTKVGYEFAIEVSTNEHQVLLPPGVSHLQAVIDVDEEESR